MGQAFMALALAGLLFGPTRTFAYWQAWTFLAVWSASSLAVTLYLVEFDRALLARRMGAGPLAEKQPMQKLVMLVASVGFAALGFVPALGHRLRWSSLPPAVALAGDALVVLGWLVVLAVFRANSFTSATVELAPGQVVISTGPYAVVRHPMYAGGLVMLFGMPIALGSAWGLIAFALVVVAIVWRLIEEEKFLVLNLAGYEAYRRRVRYRLIPYVW